MIANDKNTLSDDMFEYLQNFQLVLLTTVMGEDEPFVNAISWTYANSKNSIRFAVDNRSKIIENIKDNANIALTIFHNSSLYTIYGKASIVKDMIEEIPLKLAMVEVAINGIYDVMFYGSKISVMPEYKKDYNPVAAEKLDKQVIDALKA